MTEETKRHPRILPWFGAMIVALLAMAYLVDAYDVTDRTQANLMMAWPIVFLIPAARAAMKRAESQGDRGDPSKRYLFRMLVASLFYVGSLMVASIVIDKDAPASPLAVLLAIIPGIGVIGYFWAIGRFIVEMKDEFIRMLTIRQSLIGAAIAFSAASIWGFLENFNIAPHVDAYWWPIVFFFGIGVGAIVNKVQFGTTGECT